MTTTPARSSNGSLLIGATSNSLATSGAPRGVVIVREFNAARALPVAGAVALDEIVQKYEADPKRRDAIARARKSLAQVVYADRQDTLCALRLKAGLSQASLADRAKTSQSHIARIEAGQTDPTTDVICRIARALGADEAVTFRAVRAQQEMRGERS